MSAFLFRSIATNPWEVVSKRTNEVSGPAGFRPGLARGTRWTNGGPPPPMGAIGPCYHGPMERPLSVLARALTELGRGSATRGELCRALAPIQTYDRRTRSDLARTLRVYVECGSKGGDGHGLRRWRARGL